MHPPDTAPVYYYHLVRIHDKITSKFHNTWTIHMEQFLVCTQSEAHVLSYLSTLYFRVHPYTSALPHALSKFLNLPWNYLLLPYSRGIYIFLFDDLFNYILPCRIGICSCCFNTPMFITNILPTALIWLPNIVILYSSWKPNLIKYFRYINLRVPFLIKRYKL